MRPHYSQSSRKNATPSGGTSPLASYKEVTPPPPTPGRRSQIEEHVVVSAFSTGRRWWRQLGRWPKFGPPPPPPPQSKVLKFPHPSLAPARHIPIKIAIHRQIESARRSLPATQRRKEASGKESWEWLRYCMSTWLARVADNQTSDCFWNTLNLSQFIANQCRHASKLVARKSMVTRKWAIIASHTRDRYPLRGLLPCGTKCLR